MVFFNLVDYMNITCNNNNQNFELSTNPTNITSERDCVFTLILSIGVGVISTLLVLGTFVWIFLVHIYINKASQLQKEVIRLGRGDRTEEIVQVNRRIGNRVGRPNTDLPAYTELPNERGQLLTRSQLPNYQARDNTN